MKSDVVQWRRKKWKNNLKGLDGAIQVLIVDGILVVPDSGCGACHLIADKENPIIAWIRFNLGDCCTRRGPGHDGRLLSHGGAHGIKTKRLVNSSYGVLLVRSVVVHVALSRMTLAPGAFVRDDVIRFGKIRRPHV